MSTGHIKLWWAVKKQPDSFNIYHSLVPFSPTNLPVPVATGLSATAREFRHLDQEHERDHYYRIASVKNGRLYVSRGILVRKKPIQCIPSSAQTKTTTVTHDGEAALTYVTISRNGGAPITYVLQSNEAPPEDLMAAQLYAQDGSSIAFVDYPDMFSTNLASSSSVCGISTTGEVIASGESISLIGKEIYTNNGPATITGVRAEHNWFTVMPTPNVPRDQDIYYLAYIDSDTQNSITINSCAVLNLQI